MPNHEHNHSHGHIHNHDHGTENIVTAFFLNLGFTVIELVGGLLTNSMAILSDAVHDLGDSVALGLAWYFQKFSHKKRDNTYTYGYKRFSLVGALINSVILITGSVLILTETFPRLIHPQQSDPKGMFILAVIGVAVNGAAMLRLRKGSSLNEKVVSLHMLEDVLGWLAILVGSVVMYFVNVPVLDPIMSLLISIYVLFNVFRNLRSIARIILQGTPDAAEPDEITEEISRMESIESIHDLHMWSVDGTYNILTLHVVLKMPLNFEELARLKDNIRRILSEKGFQHATIEFETPDEQCRYENCCD